MSENGSGAPRAGMPGDVPRGVRALLHRIAEADRSLALLLGCLLSASDDSGVTTLNAVAVAFRDHHIRLVRAEGRDAERESGRLSLDEVRAYLRNSLLPRLVREGVVLLPPAGIEAPDSQLTVAPNVWEELGGYRSELARLLLETGERPSGPIPVSPEQTVPGHSLLEADGLVKTYRRRKVVNDVALRLQQGEIVGLLGPNGAGKTTCLRILSTVLTPSDGIATIAGYDVRTQAANVRAQIGFMSGNTGVYDRMTAWELAAYFGRLYRMDEPLLSKRQNEIFTTL